MDLGERADAVRHLGFDLMRESLECCSGLWDYRNDYPLASHHLMIRVKGKQLSALKHSDTHKPAG